MKNRIKLQPLIVINLFVVSILLIIAISGSQTLNAINENAPLTQKNCIILDAGHGGVDGGATSCTGVSESAINLEITLRLRDLMALLGIDTKLIRETDISVYTEGESVAAKKVSDLKNRAKFVNQTPNAILISIHQNYFTNSRYSGPQVFYKNEENSKTFGKYMQTALVKTLSPFNKRQYKKADGIYLLNNIKTAGILIECGFLSNPTEASKLETTQYQQKLCAVIATQTNMFINSLNIA